MNLVARRVVLAVTAALGLYVGVRAALSPDAFYSSFPGFGLHWLAGLRWTVFNAIHLAFHVTHLPTAPIDVVGNVVSLGLSLVLGVLLLLPTRKTHHPKEDL